VSEPLTFASVDDLAFAADRGRLSLADGGPSLEVEELGPFLEYLLLSGMGLLPAPPQAHWLALNGIADLYSALSNRHHVWVCPKTTMAGVFRTYDQRPSDETSWNMFTIAAERAALATGFPKRIAVQLAAAMGEMEGNIYEHSQLSKSGVLAFRGAAGVFEFVVADRGIGVLRSLRTCPEYEKVVDHGDALSLVLRDGVSRFGPGEGRGHGFRPLFTGLANLNGALRFRSGDHALTIDGHNPSAMRYRLAKKISVAGFFSSVRCQIAQASIDLVTP
jgi:anti-sigma regulatory factor (Ser/Thr protein kinase)